MGRFRLLALVLSIMAALTSISAAGDIVLTLTSKADAKFVKTYDMEGLEALGLSKIITTTSWTDGPITFEGVKLADVLAASKLAGDELHATAINDYAVDIPMADAAKYPVIIAIKMNGERMSVRDKGPLWVIYPRDDFAELMDETHNFKWIWQLTSIEVR